MATRISAAELVTRLETWNTGREILYRALAGALECLIRQGEIPPGTVLPAERPLAHQLNVSRGTVMAAYEAMRERRLVATVHGSGTVVLRHGSPVSGPREAHLTTALPRDSLLASHSNRTPDHIDLGSASWGGSDALRSIPAARLHHRMLEAADASQFDALGALGLRNAIAGHLTTSGLPTCADELLITSGAQQAISLTVQLYVTAGEVAVVEDPSYPGVIEALVAQQAQIKRVPVGTTGVELARLTQIVQAADPRLIYLVPSVHNPTGAVTPRPARQRLVELLADWHTIVLDDTTLLETQIDGLRPLPLAAYADEATAARIITVGSLSKSIWDGLRIGWIRASRTTIARLARLKTIADLRAPHLTQVVAEELMRDPQRLFGERRRELGERRAVMGELLRSHLPEWQWKLPAGGLCFWVNTGLDDSRTFCETANRYGVAVFPPDVSSATMRFPGHLRLCYAQPIEVLREAVLRLEAAWHDHQRTSGRPGVTGQRLWAVS